eukprot:TRINITY_DN4323_c0_g1_i1.p1 TRINITY_DN4323_c0_g1~~TRINITY_DN4323_c0_g1_i1.p1  ORF type:complete len:947 (+),score=373.46 TRINITY_DN4323_c0_g1_i1:83-2923(+)
MRPSFAQPLLLSAMPPDAAEAPPAPAQQGEMAVTSPPGDPQKGQEAELSGLQRCSMAVDTALKDLFGWLAGKIADRPWLCIALCLICTVIFASGFSMYEEENEGSKLWTPQDTAALDDKEWVERVFGYGDRQTVLYAEGRDGGNVITTARLLSFLEYWRLFEQYTVPYGSETLGWSTGRALCVKDQGSCRQPRSVLGLWNYSAAQISADPNPLATLNAPGAALPPGGPGLSFYLGSVERDGAGQITAVGGLRLVALLENNIVYTEKDGQHDPQAEEWEEASCGSYIGRGMGELQCECQSAGYFSKEAGNAIRSDIVVLPIGYLLTLVFVFSVFWRRRWLRSHLTLAAFGVLSVGLATLSAYGLALYCGVKYNPVVSVLVLVLLGIGVDDTFVIYDAWCLAANAPDGRRETDVKARLVRAMRDAGPSITTTSVTDMAAFAAGTATVLPALQGFCVYACFGILFDFLYQITFVVAVLFLEGRRQTEAGCCCCDGPRADCCCCVRVDAQSGWFGCCNTEKPESENQKRWLQRLMSTQLPDVLLTPAGTAVVAAAAVGLLVAGVIGTVNLEMDFDFEWFVPKDSELQDTFAMRDRHFVSRNLPFEVYTGDVAYHAEAVQRQLMDLEAAVAANDRVQPDTLSSWYEAFRSSLGTPAGSVVPAAGFYASLRAFLASPQGLSFNDSLRWDPTGARLVAGEFGARFSAAATSDGQAEVDTMDSIRGTVSGGGWDRSLEARAYTPAFIGIEGLAVIQWETLRNIMIAAACVFVVCLILLADIFAACIVLIAIVMIDIDLLGFSHWAGYSYNSVTCIQAVLAVGLSVDYTAHIVRAYLSHAGTYKDRARFSLGELGAAVTNGGFSTFLAVLPLAAANSYVFEVFFVMFSFIIAFGLFHGVLLVPALLAIAGPKAYPGAKSCHVPVEGPAEGDTQMAECSAGAKALPDAQGGYTAPH